MMNLRKCGYQDTRRQSFATDESVPAKYQSKLPILAAKKKDLMSLCKSGVIPSEYYEYYKSLPATTFLKDILAEQDRVDNSN